MLSLLITFLEVEGYEVVQVNSGENAYKAENVLSILRRESPSLALMDVNLKYANGVAMSYTDNKKNKQGVVFEGTDGWIYVKRGFL